MQFRVRNAKMNVFRSKKPDDGLDPVNIANELLKVDENRRTGGA